MGLKWNKVGESGDKQEIFVENSELSSEEMTAGIARNPRRPFD